MDNANTAEATDQGKRYWLSDNPGVLTRIAREFGVTQAFLSDIFHKRRNSRTRNIEARLAELGAPGFDGDTNAG